MLASVIIPTHNPKFLYEAIESVQKQDWNGDIEIVLVPNGGVKYAIENLYDRRIKVVPYTGAAGNIGAIKRLGFTVAKGDILIELDHDDLLSPVAVSRIADALSKSDFAYSNSAMFTSDWKPQTFGEAGARCGWKYRDVMFRGHLLKEAIAFEPTPASIGHIWWAPDHVRAWTRAGYDKAGGHNADLVVADDHDLVIRTYLTGTMTHIDECLYFYRVGVDNTSAGARNGLIQQETHRLYSENIDAIVRRWANLKGLPLYDLGGLHNNAPGWEPIDVALDEKHDLRGKWPWADNSVGAFRAFDFFEHLYDKMHTLSEMHRCLVPGGWALTCTPSALGRGAFQDPTHISYWVKDSFRYVSEGSMAQYIGNKDVRFQIQRLVEGNPWVIVKSDNGELEVRESQYVPYVTADLVALKEGYDGRPGEVNI